MSQKIPAQTKVVIVGGGIVGCSVAYHLAKFGWKDVVLLEQNRLGGGTTWHAAGLVGRLRTSNGMTKINKYSAELYAGLKEETGHDIGWKQVGSLIVARSEDRMIQLRRTMAMAELFGVEAALIEPAAALEKWPLLRIDDVLGAAWLPHDGKVIPKEVPAALAEGARRRGALVIEGARVLAVEHQDGRATGVKTDVGSIEAEFVVLCGGMWARQLALGCGVSLPLHAVEHHYIVSEPIPGAHDSLPVGRDPDLCLYFRGEGDGVMLGAFQKYTKPWLASPIPDDFSFKLLEADWEKFQEPLNAGKWRIPALANARFERFVNGPESFTPDNQFLLGETPELRRLFVAAGFNSVGIASAGGAGKYLAEWMIEGQPTLDLWSVDVRRFGPWANNPPFLRERVTEVLGLHYQLAWPNREFETGRGLRRSPLHDRLRELGACFGSKNGWERPNWFARTGEKPVMEYSFGRQNWFGAHAEEHKAARERVALFDQSPFAKFAATGRDSLAVLQRLCANNLDVPVGRAVYTGLLNHKGGYESDLVAVREGAREFYLVTGTAQAIRDRDWILRHVEKGEEMRLEDVTNAFAVIGVMGPRSRALLQTVCENDLTNATFPFGATRTIHLGRNTARAVRMAYVGELGWELHIPVEQAASVYELLWDAGQAFGVANAGHYAINSLRLEKGYRAWGSDISPDDTPLEAGLGFAVDWGKSFLGKEALLAQKRRGIGRRLFTFVLSDPEPVLWGSEPILHRGKPVGYTTSGSYGHTLGAAVGMGYVNAPGPLTGDGVEAGGFEIEVNGRRYSAACHARSPYDPERTRILG